MYKTVLFFMVSVLFTGCSDQEQKMKLAQLRDTLEKFIPTQPGEVAVSLDIPFENSYIGIHDSVIMHAASTMKVPVMIEAFRQAESGKISLDDSVAVINRFSSIIDGSPYALDIADDGGESLYDRIGHKESVHNLIEIIRPDLVDPLALGIGLGQRLYGRHRIRRI